MLMSQLYLFVDLNRNADVEWAATPDQKRIGTMIDTLQKLSSEEERQATSPKVMIALNVTGNTEVIAVETDRQSASGRSVRRRTKTTHFGAGRSDEDITLHPSKGGENVFVDVESRNIHSN